MTLMTGDRVRYIGPDEDYECAVGSVVRTATVLGSPLRTTAIVQWDGETRELQVSLSHLEKVSGRLLVNDGWGPARWPADMQDAGAAAHIKRQQDKRDAVQQYRDEHRGVEPELPFDEVHGEFPPLDATPIPPAVTHNTLVCLEPDSFESKARDVYEDAVALLLRKHQDYGPLNISRSPGGPLNGLRVRVWDKLARINNLVDTGATPENESLRDSWLDLMNYSAIALLVLDGDWPSE